MGDFRLTFKPAGCLGAVGLAFLMSLAGPSTGASSSGAGTDSCHTETPADTGSAHSESSPDTLSCHSDPPPEAGSAPAEDRSDSTAQASLLDVPELVGVDEKLGQPADLNTTFKDEQGRALQLSSLVDRPTLLLPVYYHCPTACQMMLGGLSSLVDDVPLELGKDYRILAVSFDHDDTPAIAAKTKANYIKLIEKEFPPEYFMYLTGGRSEIRKLLDSVGYRFHQREQYSFLHPNALIVLSADGTIIRYLYGPSFLAFDIGMALTEAEKGTPSLSIRKLMTYCFSYNPEKKTYTFTAVRYIMIGALLLLALVMFLLLRKKRREA